MPVWTLRRRGAGPIGVVRSFVCWQISRFANEREIRRVLEDAFRGILKADGTIESDWSMTRVIEIGDRATGVPVLRELYEKMKASPAPVDLITLEGTGRRAA